MFAKRVTFLSMAFAKSAVNILLNGIKSKQTVQAVKSAQILVRFSEIVMFCSKMCAKYADCFSFYVAL